MPTWHGVGRRYDTAGVSVQTALASKLNHQCALATRRFCWRPNSWKLSIGVLIGSLSDCSVYSIRLDGFDDMVEQAWRSFSHSDSNGMIRFKKKLQDLKIIIRRWVKDRKSHQFDVKNSLISELGDIDKALDQGIVSDTVLLKRMELMRQLQDINMLEARESLQKSKIKWAIEGDENSKFFHGIINKKRSQLSIRGVFVDGLWSTDPCKVKETFRNHFQARFKQPSLGRFKLNSVFTNRLSPDQVVVWIAMCLVMKSVRTLGLARIGVDGSAVPSLLLGLQSWLTGVQRPSSLSFEG
ncbi:hypothetical protein Tco_0918745 [Tanacetum coccineum]